MLMLTAQVVGPHTVLGSVRLVAAARRPGEAPTPLQLQVCLLSAARKQTGAVFIQTPEKTGLSEITERSGVDS